MHRSPLAAALTQRLTGFGMTPVVARAYLITLPATAAGMPGGGHRDQYLNPERFRMPVLVLLLVLGLRPVVG